MRASLLKSIIHMTRQRDSNALEYSLLATLAELYPIRLASIYKFRQVTNLAAIDDVIHLSVVERPDGQTEYLCNHDYLELCLEEVLLQCDYFRQQSVCLISHSVGSRLVIQISQDEQLSGLLCIDCQIDLHQQLEMIEALVRIYENNLIILHDSEHDKLTSLYNRRTFDKKIDHLLQTNQRRIQHLDGQQSYWLMMTDIDFFKRVNDEYGHLYGDEVLLVVSQLLRQHFQAPDLLFRFGGEEFVVVFGPCDESQAFEKVESFREKASAHEFPLVGHITLSCGYAAIDCDDFALQVLGKADKALYYAKENGRNQSHHYLSLIQRGLLASNESSSADIDLF